MYLFKYVIFVYFCIYIFIYSYIHIFMYYVFIYLYVSIFIHIYIYLYIFTYILLYTYIPQMSICIDMYRYVISLFVSLQVKPGCPCWIPLILGRKGRRRQHRDDKSAAQGRLPKQDGTAQVRPLPIKSHENEKNNNNTDNNKNTINKQ